MDRLLSRSVSVTPSMMDGLEDIARVAVGSDVVDKSK
jgi:hypothetical protein